MFNSRIHKQEIIDQPDCSPETIRKSHQFMRWVNRYFGGTAAVKDFIRYARTQVSEEKTLKILDIGSGSCDIPLSVIKWANRKNINVCFTCVEKQLVVQQFQAEVSDQSIKVVAESIFDYEPDLHYDYAVTSMFLHHLDAVQFVRLIRHLKKYVTYGIFINDLHRTAFTYFSCLLVTPFLPKDVRHDALVSIRKGFRKDDLAELLTLPECLVTITTRPWGRITALLEFEGDR